MEIRKTLDLNESDFMEFVSRIYGKLYVIIPVLIILLFTAVNLSSNEFSFQSMLPAVFLAAVFPPGLFFWLKRSSKKALASFHSVNGTIDVVIGDTGIIATGKTGTTKLEWRNMYKLIETKNVFFFYISKTNAIVLPKRQLSADELETILTLIKKETDPRKVRLQKKPDHPTV